MYVLYSVVVHQVGHLPGHTRMYGQENIKLPDRGFMILFIAPRKMLGQYIKLYHCFLPYSFPFIIH